MLIIILIFAVILSFVVGFYLKNMLISKILMFLFVLIAVISGTFLVANNSSHYGMKKVTSYEIQTIHSAAGTKLKAGLLLVEPVGTSGEEGAIIYNSSENAKKTTVSKPALKQTQIIRNTSDEKATLRVETTQWVYKNDTIKFWFGFLDNNKQISKTTKIFMIPNKTWVISTPESFKRLQTKMAQQSPSSSSDSTTQVTAEQQATMLKQALKFSK